VAPATAGRTRDEVKRVTERRGTMSEQIYKLDYELAVVAANDYNVERADVIVGTLRTVRDLTFAVLMIVIAVAQPLWVVLLTRFVYS